MNEKSVTCEAPFDPYKYVKPSFHESKTFSPSGVFCANLKFILNNNHCHLSRN
jgi:hypothetical protein